MKSKDRKLKLGRNSIFGLILILIIAATVVTSMHKDAALAPEIKTAADVSVSKFSFLGSSGWTQGPTNRTSLALFKIDHECFTSVEYKSGIVNANDELHKTETSLAGSGYIVSKGVTIPATIKTTTGTINYDLHQYSVSGTGNGGQLYGGQEFSYIPMDSGFIKVQGYCDASEQLPSTISSLQAIKFDVSK